MKKITLEKILFSLEDEKYVITVPKEIADKARTALDRMIAIVPKG
jgi:quinolinate synthase